MTTPEAEALAKKRYMVLNMIRVFAALMVIVGLACATDKVDIPAAHLIGVVLILFGMIDFFVMPMVLAKRWKSPDA